MNAVAWGPREPPLAPAALAVRGEAARLLVWRLLADGGLLGGGRLEMYEGVVASDLLILIGPDLPWIDTCLYLGREPRVPSLYVPTTLAPSVALELVEQAVARQFSRLERPLALLPGKDRTEVIALGGARQLARAPLEAWLAS